MLTGWAGAKTSFARFAAVAALLLAVPGTGQALAQVTLRIEPVTVIFPEDPNTPKTTIEIFMDNVPTGGLSSFSINLNENDPGFVQECLTFDKVVLDPILKAAWNNSTNSNTTVVSNVLTWTAQEFQGSPGLSDTVRLGTVTYILNSDRNICPAGTQRFFSWDDSFFGVDTDLSSQDPIDLLRGAPWVIGAVPDVDLTISCNRVSDPNDLLLTNLDPNGQPLLDPNQFVDGQTVVVDCLATNNGTDASPTGTDSLLSFVFSSDALVTSTDKKVTSNVVFASLGGGASRPVLLTGTPVTPPPGAGLTNLCVKIDVNVNEPDLTAGAVIESDETNNVDCIPVEVLTSQRDLIASDPDSDPNTLNATPSPLDPNAFRAGLLLNVDFDTLNQGIGAVRANYWNEVRLGTDAASALADPSTIICSRTIGLATGQFQKGQAARSVSLGFDTAPQDPAIPPASELCQIPFGLAPGTYSLVMNTDSLDDVNETDPNGAAAEGNNFLENIITVAPPLPPEFRVREASTSITDLTVNVFDPDDNPASAAVSIISVQDVAAFGFTLSWSPANLAVVVDPNSDVVITDFLEQNGRIQTCDPIDPNELASGSVTVSCTSDVNPDPNVTNEGATTQGSNILAEVFFTANFPGSGDLTLSSLTAEDSTGSPILNLQQTDGFLDVTGISRVRVINAVPPTRTFPGVPFSTSYEIENFGFGQKTPPLQSRIVVSIDGVTDPVVVTPDIIACAENETSTILPFTTRPKMISCTLLADLQPGSYTGFYQAQPYDPNTLANQDVVTFPISTRIATVRKSGKGQTLDINPEPDMLNGTAGPALSSAIKFKAKSFSAVRASSRNLNWLIRLKKTSKGKKVLVESFPKSVGAKLRTLTNLRLPREDKAILGAADIDGDGDDELMLLQRTKGGGEQIDFRRIDFAERRPIVCQSAAETAPAFFSSRIVSATGIEFDGTAGDEIAVVTEDGALVVYDLTISGSLPPAFPCTPVPTLIEAPADAILLALSSDTAFGTAGDEALSICALDSLLDGTEELGSLHVDGSGVQSLRIYDPPQTLGGTSSLLADDPAFGGTQTKARAVGIACTR